MKKHLRRLLAAICTAALLLTPAAALTVEQALDLLEAAYVDPLPASAYEAGTLDELFQAAGGQLKRTRIVKLLSDAPWCGQVDRNTYYWQEAAPSGASAR